MGHVDHGKLALDVLRNKRSVREFENYTAYWSISNKYKSNKITFIDTPGHAAFTK